MVEIFPGAPLVVIAMASAMEAMSVILVLLIAAGLVA